MKILVFGAGVIGTTYGWQLSEAGHDVTLFIRKQRMVRYSHSGVTITCTDMRGNKKEYGQTVFRPKTADRLDPKKPFDLIVVAVKNYQLKDAVPYISQFSGNASVLFLGNLWSEFSFIRKHLPKGRYFFGYPAMAGGGRTDNIINCYLFKKASTLIGEPEGKITERLKKVSEIFSSSGLQPKITTRIIPWLMTHYVISAATTGAVTKAGGARILAENNRLIAHLSRAIQEGFLVCRKMGITARRIFPYTMYFLPQAVIAYLLKKSFSPEKQAVVEAHMRHGFDELKNQYFDVLNDGKKYNADMTYWKSFEKHLHDADRKHE